LAIQSDKKLLEAAVEEMSTIAGQKAVLVKSKKDVSQI
jgi:ribosomal protein L5